MDNKMNQEKDRGNRAAQPGSPDGESRKGYGQNQGRGKGGRQGRNKCDGQGRRSGQGCKKGQKSKV